MPSLEIIWQQDATAHVFTRHPDDSRADERRIDAAELVRLADAPPEEPELGGSARTTFAIVELAHRGVAEGLVHPYLEHANGAWHAFWGATLDATVQKALTQIAAALPEVCAAPFDGDRDAAVHDLYPVLVDQIARDRLQADRVQLDRPVAAPAARPPRSCSWTGSPPPTPKLPPHSGYAALRRRLSAWIDTGSQSTLLGAVEARRSTSTSDREQSPMTLTRSCSSSGCRRRTIPPSACPLRSSGAAVTRCTRSCVRATRVAT